MEIRARVDLADGRLLVTFSTDGEATVERDLIPEGWIKGAYTSSGALKGIIVKDASEHVGCHGIAGAACDGAPAFRPRGRYDPEVDIYSVDLADPTDRRSVCDTCDTSNDEGIVFGLDGTGRLLSIEILYASRKMGPLVDDPLSLLL
jgi:uncharacterized protein YuzE